MEDYFHIRVSSSIPYSTASLDSNASLACSLNNSITRSICSPLEKSSSNVPVHLKDIPSVGHARLRDSTRRTYRTLHAIFSSHSSVSGGLPCITVSGSCRAYQDLVFMAWKNACAKCGLQCGTTGNFPLNASATGDPIGNDSSLRES